MGCDCNGCYICEPEEWEYRKGRYVTKDGYRDRKDARFKAWHNRINCSNDALDCRIHAWARL